MKTKIGSISLKRRRFWVIVAGLAVTLLAHATVGAVFATVITVANTNDSGPGSLRQAVFDADRGDEINFDASLSGQTIILTTGQLMIEEDLTITGLGADQLTISGNKMSGVFENMSRVFEIADGVTVTFSRLAISDGFEYGEIGGGIKNSGTLTIHDSTISGNEAVGSDGGGGILNSGMLTIRNSTISGNWADGGVGGGIFNSGMLTILDSTISGNTGNSGGGGIFNRGTLAIRDSTISGNQTYSQGGGISNHGKLEISNSSVSMNYSDGTSGAIENDGTAIIGGCIISGNVAIGVGAILNSGTLTITSSTITESDSIGGTGSINNPGTLTITNSTISKNLTSGDSSGIVNSGLLEITNSTISENVAYEYEARGGGIQNRGSVTIKNTIVANHPSEGNCFNSGTFNAFGANLSTDDTCPDFTQLTPEALNLGPLADNGGPTPTQALLEGSVAIDAVSDCTLIDGVTPLETDQRGVPRPQGKACDIGAYEIVVPLLFTAVSPCRIVDTRKAGGAIPPGGIRSYNVRGAVVSQGGNSAGCPSPMGEPLAAHLNMVAVNPTGKGNLQAFPVGAGTGAGLSVNFNSIDTNLANAGTVKTVTSSGPDITVASNFSSAHTVIDVLGYYYPDGELLYTPVKPCRIVDTRKAGGIIGASSQRDFRVFGSGGTISAQGGNSSGCPSPLGQPLAAHINMVAVNPTGKGNLQAFPVGAGPGAGLSVNFNSIDTNLANAGTVKTVTGSGPDITVASNFSSAHTVVDVLGYYYPDGELSYTPVKPCRIVDTRKAGGIIGASSQRDFRVFGSGGTISAQGGNSSGCPSPLGQPLAAHINMVAVNPTGKGNLQAFPVGAGTGAGLSVNFNSIDTNLANAGTVKTVTSSGPDITVASNFSSAHTVIDVLGYYYPVP